MIYSVLIFLINVLLITETRGYSPETSLEVPDIIRYYKYSEETHFATTEDGYILTLHRISNKNCSKPPVLLVPGNLCSSAAWIASGPGAALAYLLSDQGYDVWMGNFRGTSYSRNHTKMNPDSNKLFWMYSIDDLIRYDASAMIDYVLDVTQKQKLFYVGHSLGGAMLIGLSALNPSYNSKVLGAVLFAPSFSFKYNDSPLSAHPWALRILEALNVGEVLNRDYKIGPVTWRMCVHWPFTVLCPFFLFWSCGHSGNHFNESLIPVLNAHIPAGSSLQIMNHLLQGFNHGFLRFYDYGIEGNKKKYNTTEPPEYNLKNFQITAEFIGSDIDPFGKPDDLLAIKKTIGTNHKITIKIVSGFMHLDYFFAFDAFDEINNHTIEYLEKLL